MISHAMLYSLTIFQLYTCRTSIFKLIILRFLGAFKADEFDPPVEALNHRMLNLDQFGSEFSPCRLGLPARRRLDAPGSCPQCSLLEVYYCYDIRLKTSAQAALQCAMNQVRSALEPCRTSRETHFLVMRCA